LVPVTPTARSRRDLGITALVEGFFAAAWFGWGNAAPSSLGPLLVAGSVVGLLVAVAGAVVGFRAPGTDAALSDPSANRRYGIVVGIEFGVAGLGAVVLGVAGYPAYIPVWVCAVVGVHFFALVNILRDPTLRVLGVLMCAVAVLALAIAWWPGSNIRPGLVTGVGAGMHLLIFGSWALLRAVQPPVPAT
jgi:hypothetical protein